MLIYGSFRTEKVSPKPEAEISCEMCVTSYQTTRRHIVEDNYLHSYCSKIVRH